MDKPEPSKQRIVSLHIPGQAQPLNLGGFPVPTNAEEQAALDEFIRDVIAKNLPPGVSMDDVDLVISHHAPVSGPAVSEAQHLYMRRLMQDNMRQMFAISEVIADMHTHGCMHNMIALMALQDDFAALNRQMNFVVSTLNNVMNNFVNASTEKPL